MHFPCHSLMQGTLQSFKSNQEDAIYDYDASNVYICVNEKVCKIAIFRFHKKKVKKQRGVLRRPVRTLVSSDPTSTLHTTPIAKPKYSNKTSNLALHTRILANSMASLSATQWQPPV